MKGCKPTYNWWRPTHSEIVIHGKSRGQTNHTFGWDRGEPWKPEHYWGFTYSLVPSSAHAKRHTHIYIIYIFGL